MLLQLITCQLWIPLIFVHTFFCLSRSATPSSQPSDPPTGALYYPDWENESQVCTNDGNDPSYMKEIQKLNYLYLSKEDCCATHFWWRIAQCMENEHPLWAASDGGGQYCEQRVNLEQWEVKYTPADWSSSDLFDTLSQCCNNKFWWDVNGCLAESPQELKFMFTFDIMGLIQFDICQDTDNAANALEVAMERGLGGGDAEIR